MIDKYIQVLEGQLAKLEKEDFDLEAWKSGTIVLLARIFGDASTKISEIEKIKFDFSSWSLRDASGSVDQLDACKTRCRGVVEACITELQILGAEEENQGELDKNDALVNAIGEELNMSDYRKLVKIVKSKSGKGEKKDLLVTELMEFDTRVAPSIVANILTDPAFAKSLS